MLRWSILLVALILAPAPVRIHIVSIQNTAVAPRA
jgi:hypothetical protein